MPEGTSDPVLRRQSEAGTKIDGIVQPELSQKETERIVAINSASNVKPTEEFDMDRIRDLQKKQGENVNLDPDDRQYLARYYLTQPTRR